jgi:DMSO/TMAO reductase YedYZ molybdopterin-dependent catalytic subunit
MLFPKTKRESIARRIIPMPQSRRSLLQLSMLAPVWTRFLFARTRERSSATTLNVSGNVETPLTLASEDLTKMKRDLVSIPRSDGTKGEYEGVPLSEILTRARAPLENRLRGKALASYVLATGTDGYQVLFALSELDAAFAKGRIIVADKRDGQPLLGAQGPFRLVCADDRAGARSVRMLESIEVVRLKK